ncbi:HlyD family type I secretion periplasmic adaptor subunit [Dyella mobilis]|uniref:Membrane fusion protein (MFP) family protein n=1 Tax=Dyella mobilis TaxID=1849582 RepID=A0ABS2KLY8_9GAMM|nr:HlyD family type I secretion periplasmic adaptor subunit [Dyella mobilis]MBM7132172.1 HlyD family type I secretion periplasmic adaptor subunit [Dyella mobilis]GLQ95843.1 HlyD family type I secretion periplasmic adaptor subunit [Dyella mobilis]
MKLLDKLRQRSVQPRVSRADAAFIDDLQQSLLTQSTAGTKIVLYLIFVILVGGLVWARFAHVEEVTRGEATVVARSGDQVIQSLEGGILETLSVRQGDTVKKGQLLAKIDPTRAETSYREAWAKAIGLKATIARLRAEAYGTPLTFPGDVKEAGKAQIEQETHAYDARRKALNEAVAALQKSYDLQMQELALSEPLAEKGLLSEVELLRMKRQASDAKAQIVDQQNRFKADAQAELVRDELELSQTQENVVGRADVLLRTDVTAPVDGIVKKVSITTLGGVIQPGEHIMEITPLEDTLLLEARVKPSDIAFVHAGEPAMVKITAYDYGIYGGLKGKVTFVSPDTLKDDQKAAAGRPDATYYRVDVITDSNALHAGGKTFPILPGMTGTVDIRTGEKTIFDYLMKPIFKAREAFRER